MRVFCFRTSSSVQPDPCGFRGESGGIRDSLLGYFPRGIGVEISLADATRRNAKCPEGRNFQRIADNRFDGSTGSKGKRDVGAAAIPGGRHQSFFPREAEYGI